MEVELGDGVDQLLWLEVGGDGELIGRIAVVLPVQSVLRERSVGDTLPPGCFLVQLVCDGFGNLGRCFDGCLCRCCELL